MTAAGKSLFYFGIYALGAGLLFVSIPGTIVSFLHLPDLPTGWTRVIGAMALVIGTYDVVCGRADNRLVIKMSIYTRLGFALCTALLVLTGQMPWPIFLIGLMDALGALWTVFALRTERTKMS